LEGFDVYSGNETSDTASYVGKAASAYRKEGRKIEFPIYGGRQILHIQSSARSGDSIDLIYECLSNTYLGIGGLDVSTYEKAGNSIEVIDNAMRIVSGQRSEFGAYLNRMEHAKANAENTGENTQSAESNIRDADMGSVMLAFNLYDILTQAGQAMLAQSNQSKSRVLELLQ
jgi:flagellin-like hook-associated protein FlgL